VPDIGCRATAPSARLAHPELYDMRPTPQTAPPTHTGPSPQGPARRFTPWHILLGFTALLLALFAASFGIGRLAGPVSPGVLPGFGHHSGSHMPAMPGMSGMAGMTMRGTGTSAPHPAAPGTPGRTTKVPR
jgi:hypothetical protein